MNAKKSYRNHFSLKHGTNRLGNKKCSFEDCSEIFVFLKDLINHLESQHAVEINTEVLQFSNDEGKIYIFHWLIYFKLVFIDFICNRLDFNCWKSNSEKESNSFFTLTTSKTRKSGKVYKFFGCNRTGLKDEK